ncbi:hypothetical protein [Mucilaginibacter sp.]
MANPLLSYINTNKKDAVEFKTSALLTAAGDDMYRRSEAVEEIKNMLACMTNDILVEGYIKRLAPITGLKAAVFQKIIKEEKNTRAKKQDEEQHVGEGQKAIPKWVNKDRLNDIGFDWRVDQAYPDNTGMYFPTSGGHMQKLTNFVMKPIVQIISEDDDSRRRITEISNGRATHVFELPSKAFISQDSFETILLDQGYYHYEDGFGKPHLNKIKSYFLMQYPIGYELTNLGWQDEGFFAFSNVIYHNGVINFDDYGLAKVKDMTYLSMGASNILKNLRKNVDIYKNDKYLKYERSPISFKVWTQLMLDVYEDKAMMGVAWVMLAANKDIVQERSNYCPIPYCYGAAQSGKSKFVESICNLSTKGRMPFNLNQGTEFAFWDYVGRFKNVPAAFNEFDDMAVDEKRVRAFKGMADGEGRIKGAGRKGRTKTEEVNSLPVLLGQYLASMDDNSLLSRTIPEKFVENNDRTAEQIKNFELLKAYEKQGMSSLYCEVLEHRGLIETYYQETYSKIASALKADFSKEGLTPKNRVLENYITVLTLIKLYSKDMELAFSYETFYAYCKKQIMNLNNLIGESNSLGEFWKAVEYLSDFGLIEPGWDYKIETVTEVKSMIGDKSSKNVYSFDKPTRLLFLRLNNIYPPYAKEKKNRTGKAAIGDSTIKTYLQDQAYYVGAQSGGNFKSKNQNISKVTSSMVLNYDLLCAAGDINLERSEADADPGELVILEGYVHRDAIVKNVWGIEKLVFTLWVDESYLKDSILVKNEIFTSCYWLDLKKVYDLKLGAKVKVTGQLTINQRKEQKFRTLEVTSLEITQAIPAISLNGNPQAGDHERKFIPPTNRQMTFGDDLRAEASE